MAENNYAGMTTFELLGELQRICEKMVADADQSLKRMVQHKLGPELTPCGCCTDKYPADEMVTDRFNGLICKECADAFADVVVPEFDPLDKD